MSLLNSACCTNTCACLPSSYQISISTFTITFTGVGTFIVPAQTVTAFKCCVTFDNNDGFGLINRILYRPSLINIGTYTTPGCAINFPVYLAIVLGIGIFNLPPTKCVVDFNFQIFINKHDGLACAQCATIPSVITSNNACHFAGTNEICYDANLSLFTNTFFQDTAFGYFSYASYFDDCVCGTIPSPLPVIDCCSVNVLSIPFIRLDYSYIFSYFLDHICNLTEVHNNNGPGYVTHFNDQSAVFVTCVVS